MRVGIRVRRERIEDGEESRQDKRERRNDLCEEMCQDKIYKLIKHHKVKSFVYTIYLDSSEPKSEYLHLKQNNGEEHEKCEEVKTEDHHVMRKS